MDDWRVEGKSDLRDWKDRKKTVIMDRQVCVKSAIFILDIYIIFSGKSLKIDEKSSWEALGVPKFRKMVPRGSWTAPRGCPGVPRRAQRGKNEAQEPPKNAFGTPI